MNFTQEDIELITTLFMTELRKEFEHKHMSMNLVNTVRIENDNGKIKIHIPAKMYNMKLFQQEGVVVHTSNGSYAEKLDKEGSSFYVYPGKTRKGSYRVSPKNHIGFINRVLNKVIQSFISIKGYEITGKEEGVSW